MGNTLSYRYVYSEKAHEYLEGSKVSFDNYEDCYNNTDFEDFYENLNIKIENKLMSIADLAEAMKKCIDDSSRFDEFKIYRYIYIYMRIFLNMVR
jgi:hypothetical protein